ncbi:MAG: AI-2E family transporter [Candidatus Moranbacteria bacterium]|nr:AI-2E family transporter [Candidatus Moranbacteria bacterium]
MKKEFNTIFLVFLLVLVGIGVFLIFKPFIIPIFLAFIISQFFKNWYEKLNKKLGNKRSISSFIMCLLVFFIFVVPIAISLTLVISETKQIIEYINNNNWENKIETLVSHPLIQDNRDSFINFDFKSLLKSEQFKSVLKSSGNIGINLLKNTYQSTSSFIFMAFLMFFTLYYLFKDNKKIIKKIMRISPLKNKQEEMLFEEFISISKATIKGSLVIAVIQGVLLGLLFWMTQVPSPALWGLVSIITSLIPMLGAGLVWFPAGVIMIIAGNIWQGVLILIMGALVISSVDNFLRPKLVGDSSSLHPLLVFFSTLGGIALFGILGFLIGPIIVVLFMTLISIYEMEFKKELKKFND